MSSSPFDIIIPVKAELTCVVDGYGPLPDEVPCGMENCREMHLHGFYVEFTWQGNRAVGAIGRNCGRKYFGADWKVLKADYRRRQNEQKRAERVRHFLPEAESVLTTLKSLMVSLHGYKTRRELLQTRARLFFAFLEDAVKRGDGWIGRDEWQTFVRLERIGGQQFFLEPPPMTDAQILQDDIERVIKIIEQGKQSDTYVASRVTAIGNLRKRLDLVEVWVVAAGEALSGDNLDRITGAYAEVTGRGEVRVSKSGRWFIVQDCPAGTQLFSIEQGTSASAPDIAA